MNTEQYRKRLGELRRNWEEPSFDHDPEWIDLMTGEPRGESMDANNLHCVQLKAKKDLVIHYVNRWAILTKGSVVEKYSSGTYGSTFHLVSGEMWTRRKDKEPYLIKPYRMDYLEDGRINHERVYLKNSSYSTGYRNANWFVFGFSVCGTTNTYPSDYGLFHKSMWDLQYIKTYIRNNESYGTEGYMESLREWGTRIHSHLIHPDIKGEVAWNPWQ